MEREQNRYVDRKRVDEWIGVLVIVLERGGRDKDVCLFLLFGQGYVHRHARK